MVSGNHKKSKNSRNKKKNKMRKQAEMRKAVEMHMAEQKTIQNQLKLEDTQEGPSHPLHTEQDTKLQKTEDNLDDSDVEEPKKRKKKRPVPVETPNTKGAQKSIRQMKREKYFKRQVESKVAAKDQLKKECLSYLSQWKHDRQNWKFMKIKQVWLLKNKFSLHLVPDNSWPLLMEYFESAKGNIRNILLEDSNKVIKQMDEWSESQTVNEDINENNEVEDSEPNITKPDETTYKRARDLIQLLAE